MNPELDLDGPAAPPRINGELVFSHPWQGRLFATTMALCDAGRLDYGVFRDRLIAAIAASVEASLAASLAASVEASAVDVASPGGVAPPAAIASPNDSYWAAWQDALEAELEHRGLCDATELTSRSIAFAEHH